MIPKKRESSGTGSTLARAQHAAAREGRKATKVIKSKTRVGHIQRWFRYSDETEKKMRVQIARIAALYDDLMLEYRQLECP